MPNYSVPTASQIGNNFSSIVAKIEHHGKNLRLATAASVGRCHFFKMFPVIFDSNSSSVRSRSRGTFQLKNITRFFIHNESMMRDFHIFNVKAAIFSFMVPSLVIHVRQLLWLKFYRSIFITYSKA